MNSNVKQTVIPAKVFKSEAGRQAILDYYQTLLARMDFTATEAMVPTRFGETYVLSAGDASLPPLVLLHGSTSNSASWFGDIGPLSRHFRVHAVDLIGDAGHSAEVRPDPRGDGYAAWLGDVFDALGLASAAVLGNSLGGWVALRFATRFPERVTRLALVAAAGLAPIRASFLLRVLWVGITGRGSTGVLRLVFGDEPVHPDVREFMTLMTRHYTPLTATLPLVTDDELRRLSMPVRYVAGDADALTNAPKSAARLRRVRPEARVDLLAGKPHAVFGITALVLPFLRGEAAG